MVHWRLCMLLFFHSFENIESYHSDLRGLLTKSSIWSSVEAFLWRIISVFPIACMCLVWLNMHIFYWILVLIMPLSLRAVMIFTLLNFPVIFWLFIAYKTCWGVAWLFLPIISIQTLVLFLYGNSWFHGILLADWEMYGMLWCLYYCVTTPMWVPFGGKLTLHSNRSSL